MRDARLREFAQRPVQRDGVGRRQRAIDGQRPRDDSDGAERGGLKPKARPDLAYEGGDRGLAAGAGDGDDGFRLAGVEGGGGLREREAGVGNLHEGGVAEVVGATLRDHSGGAAFDRLRDMLEAVVLGAGQREEGVAGRDLAAVGREAGDLDAEEFG